MNTIYADMYRQDLFWISGDKLLGFNSQNTDSKKHLIIPEGIRIIGDRAFCECKEIETVEIPEGVEEIGERAFQRDNNLVSVTLPSTLKKIGDSAFYDCGQLKNVAFPPSLEEIGPYAFHGCSELAGTAFPSSLQTIGAGAFDQCRQLAADDGFISINGRLFGYYGKAEKLVVPDGVRSLEAGCCMENASLREVVLPESVEVIGDSAFLRCSNLSTIVLPQRLRTIGNSAFYYCTSLKDITIPKSVETICAKAFFGCSELESFTFEAVDHVQIGSHAFQGCNKLADPEGFILFGSVLPQYVGSGPIVRIPEGVRRISDMAFAENKTVKEVVFPTSLESIGDGAFWKCKSLSGLTWHDGLREIGENAFSNTALKAVTIPKTVRKIGVGAFGYCHDITVYDSIDPDESLLYVYPDGVILSSLSMIATEPLVTLAVKQQGMHPWTGHYLTVRSADTDEIKYKVWIGASAKDNFFGAWKTHAQFDFEKYDNPTQSGDFADALRYCDCRFEYPYELTAASKETIVKYMRRKARELLSFCVSEGAFDEFEQWVDRGAIDKENFARIYDDAVKLPAAEYVDFLEKFRALHFPETKSSLDTWEFTKGKPPKVTRYNGTESELVFPSANGTEKVRGIAARTKAVPDNYHSVVSVVIPEGYETIGNFAFYGMENLETVVLPDTIMEIGDSAFENCVKLKNIVIPFGVEALRFRTFRGCKALETISLPPALTYVEVECFNRSGLKRVAIRADALNRGRQKWRCFPPKIQIYCKPGVVKRYGEFKDENVHPLEEYPD